MITSINVFFYYFRTINNSQEIREFLDSSFLSTSTSLSNNENLRNSTPTLNDTIDDSSNFSFASSSSSLIIDTTPLSTNINVSNSIILIKRKLLNDTGEYVLVPHGGKSSTWEKFQTVMFVKQNLENPDSLDEELTDFVACINCKELYSKTTGTATLNRHKCASELKSQKTIEMYTEITNKKKN